MNELAQIYSDSNPPSLQERVQSQIPQKLKDVWDLQSSNSQLQIDEVSELIAELKKKYPHLSEQALYLMASGLLGQRSNVKSQGRRQEQFNTFQKKMTY